MHLRGPAVTAVRVPGFPAASPSRRSTAAVRRQAARKHASIVESLSDTAIGALALSIASTAALLAHLLL